MFRDYLTLSAQNQFTFVCPIFNTSAKMRVCSTVRDLVWMGKQVTDKEGNVVRRGCQACMRDGKCPASEIIRNISFGRGQVPDDYGSKTPVEGKLRKNLLERLAPIVVSERTMNLYGVPDHERALIEGASDRMRKLAGLAPQSSTDADRPKMRRAAAKPAPKPDNSNSAVQNAAASGDMAAALNAA